MVQQVLIGLLFGGAVAFVVSLIVRNMRAREGCATGCGKCNAASADASVRPRL